MVNPNITATSKKDDRNFPTPYSDYFIENIDYKKVNKRSITTGVKVVMKSIYSFEAQENLEKLLSDVKIDFAHINVIHHYITPIILKILKKRFKINLLTQKGTIRQRQRNS